jgi:hypothetical protein
MESPKLAGMIGLFGFVLAVLAASPFKSKLRLEAENAVLRHQVIVLKRSRDPWPCRTPMTPVRLWPPA